MTRGSNLMKRALPALAAALLCAVTLPSTPASAAAGWHQRGPTISTELSEANALAASASGNVVALDEARWSSSAGRVSIYRQVSGTWDEFGTLEGVNPGDQFGTSLAFNAAGSVLVVGSGEANARTGYVKVYRRGRSGWTQLGATLSGAGAGECFGQSVDSNASGNLIAVASAGGVKVFRRGRNAWTQVGATLPAGSSVSLNSAGKVVAIGDGSVSGNTGAAHTYRLSRGKWVQLGTALAGSASNDYFGIAVDLNSAGNVLAVGATGVSAGKGAVTVYRLSSGVWSLMGSTLLPENRTATDQFGQALALDAAGKRVTVGAYCCGGTGYVKQFQWNSSAWAQRGVTLVGPSPDGAFGYGVASSSGGNVITASVGDGAAVQQFRFNS